MIAYDYELLAIGSGPAGFHAVMQAAKAGRRAAIIERQDRLGGVCVNTGTIPSKTLREAAVALSSNRRRLLLEEGYRAPSSIKMPYLMQRAEEVVKREHGLIAAALQANAVDLFGGDAHFSGDHEIVVTAPDGPERKVSAGSVVIASGSRPRRPNGVPFDDRLVVDSDGILQFDAVPKSLAVVGAGVIGCEYASIFAAIGVRVVLIDHQRQLLSFVDAELVSGLLDHLQREEQVIVHLGESVAAIESRAGGVDLRLGGGALDRVDCVLYSAGRVAETDGLNLTAIGLQPSDADGHLKVNESYQTAVPWVYAAGDVIGFPSLASTSMQQGRVAACHALGLVCANVPAHFPLGVYTIPELSMVGRTEQELKSSGTPYEIGRASYREVARGQIIGDEAGLLKLLFDPTTRVLLGVHILGEGATELVHVGQAVMNLGGTLDYLRDAIFNYPTLAEAYTVAALDGFNRLAGR